MTATPDSVHPTPDPARPAATSGLHPKIGGLLAYLLFGWIGGLIMYFTQKDPEVRFHGAQSVLLSIAIFAAYLGVGIIWTAVTMSQSMALVGLVGLLYFVLWAASLVVWIVMCVKGYQLAHVKLPVIGDIAERWATK